MALQVRMGLLLNMAVFHFEIYGNQTRAVKIARDAYDKCVSNMGKVAFYFNLYRLLRFLIDSSCIADPRRPAQGRQDHPRLVEGQPNAVVLHRR